MLSPLTIPGVLVLGTDTGIGKTMIAGAIAHWLKDDEIGRAHV